LTLEPTDETIFNVPAVATAGGLPNRLGKYELLLPLAAGGMARIYIGRSTGIGSFERHVVLKLITPERANDHTAVQMFLDEARLAAALNHQNVAQVFEVGEDLGIHYLAMEYVHGQDLRALLAKAGSQGTRIPLELALTVSAGAAAGLNHAHERRGPDGQPLGIVHRDVSPSNIMIGYDGAVKLLDFGIAKATHRSVETQSGIIKGKFAYMAPEQCRGRDVDRRSDVFSLGIILYEITTQHRCFRADSDFDTMHRIVTGDVVRPTRLIQGYPQALEAIVMKALAVDANQRYQSAGLLLEAIESFAVSARMAMSTMSLGRFMRELFGEIQEPWLQQNRNILPEQAKESTISSTDGRSNVAAPAIGRRAIGEESVEMSVSGVPDEDARFPDSSGILARTVLDLPRRPGDQEQQDPPPGEWNAKSYPQMQPAIASSSTLPPEAMARPAYPQPHHTPSQGSPPHPGPTPPHGYPQQHVPPGQFAQTPASGSHSSPAMPALVGTRHGYASGSQQNDLSYPRYEPQVDPVDMQLTPNRRPLFIGLGIAALGFIIIIAVALGGGKADDPQATPPEGSGEGSAIGSAVRSVEPAVVAPQHADVGSAKSTETTKTTKVLDPKGSAADKRVEKIDSKGSAADTHAGSSDEVDVVDDMITISIDSDPHGAEVLLGGTKIGTTPLTKKYKRASGIATLTIRKTGYTEVTTRMDLGGDFSKPKIELKKDKTEDHTPASVPPKDKTNPNKGNADPHKAGNAPPDTHKQHNNSPVNDTPKPKPKPKCQPPTQYNPFDTTCDGQPCPVCK
jgi:serine/threonine protein kinase